MALTLRAVFHLALRQTEGLIGSVITLLGLALAVPDHSTMCRRSKTLVRIPPAAWGRVYHNTLTLNADGTVSPPNVPGIGADPNFESLAEFRIA